MAFHDTLGYLQEFCTFGTVSRCRNRCRLQLPGMHFHFSFYSSLLLIFFSQGILFTLLLWYKGWLCTNRSHYWLSAFIFLCSLYIMPWMLGHAGWYSLQPYRDLLFYLPLQQVLLLGPVIFFYTQCLLNPGFRWVPRHALHFVPAGAYLLYSVVVFVTDKLWLHRYYFYADGHDKDLSDWYQLAGLLSMMVYLVLSLRYYRLYKKIILQVVSYADRLQFGWARNFLVVFLAMVVFRLLFLVLYPHWGSFTQKWWYYFIFSVLFYGVALAAYASHTSAVLAFRPRLLQQRQVYQIADPKAAYGLRHSAAADDDASFVLPDGAIPQQDAMDPATEAWKEAILRLMEQEALYRDPELTLSRLAQLLQSNTSIISRVVNQAFGLNFNDFINSFRVAAVSRQIRSGGATQQTLLALAYECGFNSKTTFNRAFRKFAGCAPSQLLQEVKETLHREAYTPEKEGFRS